jgi:hypothetical protein
VQRVTRRTTEAKIRVIQLEESPFRKDLNTEDKKIAIIRSRNQATTSKDTAGWKRLSMIL